jgi:hypothetical protein
MYVLIDITNLEQTCMPRVAELRQIIELSKLQKVAGRTVIGPELNAKAFTRLEKEQLQYIVWNHTQTPPPEDYGELVQKCLAIALEITPDESSLKELETLVKNSGYDDAPAGSSAEEIKAAVTPKAKVAKPAKTGEVARPKEGTATGAVWDICDEMTLANGGVIPDRKLVIDKCVEEGVNKATASTQFGKWKKAQGSI